MEPHSISQWLIQIYWVRFLQLSIGYFFVVFVHHTDELCANTKLGCFQCAHSQSQELKVRSISVSLPFKFETVFTSLSVEFLAQAQ